MDIFCQIIKGEIKSYTIYEDEIIKVIMDVNPKTNGHSLIIPKKHYRDLFDIDDEVLRHIMIKSREISKLLMEKLGCDGITLEENNGIIQEVKHFHLHLIPRYEKDRLEKIEEVYDKIMN